MQDAALADAVQQAQQQAEVATGDTESAVAPTEDEAETATDEEATAADAEVATAAATDSDQVPDESMKAEEEQLKAEETEDDEQPLPKPRSSPLAQAVAEEEETSASPLPSASGGCESIAPQKTVNTEWCINNCAMGNCPTTLCSQVIAACVGRTTDLPADSCESPIHLHISPSPKRHRIAGVQDTD